ncbi:ABC transporter [seawater metagenome]|uniref:ABC transporter n=1 Tax=seawater metagenome TaxID=1561972 RepID=A0A5E8CKY1_9ZZZZ
MKIKIFKHKIPFKIYNIVYNMDENLNISSVVALETKLGEQSIILPENEIQENKAALMILESFAVTETDKITESMLKSLTDVDTTNFKNMDCKWIQIIQNLLDIFLVKKQKSIYNYISPAVLKCMPEINEWYYSELIDILKNKTKKSTKDLIKYNSLLCIKYIAENYPLQIKLNMLKLIPFLTDLLYDLKNKISSLAFETMELVLKCSGNKDLDPFLPIVLDALKNTDKMSYAVEQLAGCVFVQNIETPALAITCPILNRGLVDTRTETRRKCCVIIDNMCKLVEHPKEIIPIIDELKPRVKNCAENISNPEARHIAEKALATINIACGKDDIVFKEVKDIEEIIRQVFQKNSIQQIEDEYFCFLSVLAKNLCNANHFILDQWILYFNNYLKDTDKELSEKICQEVFEIVKTTFIIKEDFFEDTEEGQDLYKGVFSLAYGALTLLNNTHLHLKRNRFYGLLGPNNCGKTTLMRAISNEQVDGFPKKDELKTIFVEHEIQEREIGEDKDGYPIFNMDLCGIDWVVDCCNEVYKLQPPVTREQVEDVMEEIGFGNSKKDSGKDRAADAEMGVTTYSGGWKMKMQLCAATLMNADILMLDEPTGHLDVKNIQWLKDWLSNFKNKGGSIITTSHDSSFLDEMCTHIIDFQNRKLCMFRGDKGMVLKQFVEKFPEKKGYFELKNDVMKFTFPVPQKLEKKGSSVILKMNSVSFQYPIRDKPTVMNISLVANTSSRVAVIGPNGAGKSTAIKLLIGELKPSQGTVWRNPNARIAYVAQHAFQHLEKHITKTPAQYIMWRFAGNEDKESLEFRAEENEEEVQKTKYFLKKVEITYELRKCTCQAEEKIAVYPDYFMGRRELKKEKTKEYEVKWVGKPREESMWVKKEMLLSMGTLTMMQRYDEKLAAEAGLMSKTLTTDSIEKHLKGFGIEAEQASHTLLGSLSGGQKVKVVLAASMWLNPHLVILDEPTNYLDRDGLGALTKAIEEFKGGVVIISHNREFANAVAQEKWIMEAGRLRKEGESIANQEEETGHGNKVQDDTFTDSHGNVLKINRKAELSEKDKKTEIKRITKRIKSAKKNNDLTQEEIWELEEKLDELKGE